MDLSVFFAGTGGSMPTARRGLPAILIRRGGERILVDCGEGTQRQLLRSVGLIDVDEVFITHFHADHWLGLPGLLKTFDLRGRERTADDLRPARPGRAARHDRTCRRSRRLRAARMPSSSRARCSSATATGSRPCRSRTVGRRIGYVLFEDERPGVFDPAAAQARASSPGPSSAACSAARRSAASRPTQVMGPPRAGPQARRSRATPARPRRCGSPRTAATCLIHEATFAIEEAERAYETGHSTASQAAGVARDAEVGLLALYHVSIRYPAGLLQDEARAIFESTVLPRDFDTIEIPFPEKGAPELIRWSDSQPEPVVAVQPARPPVHIHGAAGAGLGSVERATFNPVP